MGSSTSEDTGEGASGRGDSYVVAIYAGGPYLRGELTIPPAPVGAVVVVHGTNPEACRSLVDDLAANGLATLAVDIAREHGAEEPEDEIERARRRVSTVVDWLRAEPVVGRLPQGLYAHGGECGGAACLMVAAERPGEIGAVALRCGRPDRAGRALGMRLPPTMLLLGERHVAMQHPARDAFRRLRTNDKSLESFEGTEEAVLLTVDWFARRLGPTRRVA